MVLPFPGGPNNKIPRTGARKPVNIYEKRILLFSSMILIYFWSKDRENNSFFKCSFGAVLTTYHGNFEIHEFIK
jgi:hypothetical protein